LGGLYALGTSLGVTAFGIIAFFGFLIAGVMWLIMRWHASNLSKYPAEEAHLIEIATHDGMHD
jgi:hypothetical protein